VQIFSFPGNPLIDDYGKNDLTRPGENGVAVVMPPHLLQNVTDVLALYHINVIASDMIPLNRLVPDSRFKGCVQCKASKAKEIK
jgi:hypothetical protein